MSMTTELIERLRQHADTFEKSGFAVDGLVKDYREAADTIQLLSEKLHASQMERSSQYYNDGWIPVSERLPDNDNSVLISNSNGVTKAWWNGRFWTSIAVKKYKTVTAWMPLPKTYKAERRDKE